CSDGLYNAYIPCTAFSSSCMRAKPQAKAAASRSPHCATSAVSILPEQHPCPGTPKKWWCYTGNAHDPHLCCCWSKTAPTVGRVPAVMVVREACPMCGFTQYKKNGHSRHDKQNHQCRACAQQFVAVANDRHITDAQRTMVEHLLCERISLRGICRAVGV